MSLNSLSDARAGGDLSLRPLGRQSQIDPARASVLRRVRRRVAAYGPCPSGFTPLGAHQELLKTSDVYCEDGRSLREPYDADRVKLLSGDIEPKEAASPAPDHVRYALDNAAEQIERSGASLEDEPHVRPYWDPLLDPSVTKNRSRLVDFLKKLKERGQICACLWRKADIGFFFVRKKTGALRVIVDTRQPNHFHKVPPHCSMASVEALAAVTVGQAWMTREQLCEAEFATASVDLKDGFHQFKNEKLASWFTVPSSMDDMHCGAEIMF